MSFPSLPYEVQCEILRYAIHLQPAKHVLACVNSIWRDITLPIIHSNIRLETGEQLRLFSEIVDESETRTLECCPQGRTVEIHLSPGSFTYGVWEMIFKALKRCEHRQLGYTRQWFHNNPTAAMPIPPKSCCKGIRVLKFYVDATNTDPGVVLLGAVLSQIRPEEFVWNRPIEQSDHPSIILSVASLQLCRGIRRWDSISVLDLSDITFPDDGKDFVDAITNLNQPPRTQTFREMITRHSNNGLEDSDNPTDANGLKISLRRAVGLHPAAILFIILGQPRLTKFYLEDVHRRIDLLDARGIDKEEIESTFLALWDGTDMRELPETAKSHWIARVGKIVEVVNHS